VGASLVPEKTIRRGECQLSGVAVPDEADGTDEERVRNLELLRYPIRMGEPEPTDDTASGLGVTAALLRIWQNVFETQVGATDNFFDLNGNSFTALRLLTRIRGELGCEISIADLLDYPTIAELAVVVQQSLAGI
jgi:acyl carrier protein